MYVCVHMCKHIYIFMYHTHFVKYYILGCFKGLRFYSFSRSNVIQPSSGKVESNHFSVFYYAMKIRLAVWREIIGYLDLLFLSSGEAT